MPQLSRKPYVAGYFYPGERDLLLRELERLFKSSRGPGKVLDDKWRGREVLGAILPHAGYMYSGEIAAHGYAAYFGSGLKKLVIVLGPNHHGLGASISIYPGGEWETPLGKIPVNKDFIDKLSKFDGYLALDDLGHRYEHSLEVHIPFLQYVHSIGNIEFEIVPIAMLLQTSNGVMELGNALVEVLGEYDLRDIFIVASTDFTHYESAESAKRKDEKAFEAIMNMDAMALIDNVYRYDISMCGFGPTATLLYIAEKLGGYKASLLKYGHSGEVTGDNSNVVSYAAFIIYK